MHTFNIEHIREQVNLVDLIRQDEPLQKHGDSYRSGHESAGHGSQSGTCLDVSETKQVFLCRNCGEKGDIFDWVMQRDNVPFIEAAKWICDTYNIPYQDLTPEEKARLKAARDERKRIRPISKEIMQFFHDAMEAKHRDYYRERGIKDETIKELLLGYAPADPKALVDLMRDKYPLEDLYKTGLFHKTKDGAIPVYLDRLVFPYWRGDDVVYSIGRLPDHMGLELTIPREERHETDRGKYKKHLIHKESRKYVSQHAVEHVIYGVDSIRGADECLIAEGIVDAILVIQQGFACLSPVTTTFKAEHIEALVRLTRNVETVDLPYDNEESEAGLEGALSTAGALFDAGRDVRIVTLPRSEGADKTDLADFLSQDGELDENTASLKGLMAESPDHVEWQIEQCKALPRGRKRESQLRKVLALVAKADPLAQDRYVDVIAQAKLAKAGAIREALKKEKASQRDEGATEKTAIQLSDELIEQRYTHASGVRMLLFQHDSYFAYDGTKHAERSKSEFDTAIVAKIRQEADLGTETDVSQHLVTSIRLATYPLIALPNTVEMPCWMDRLKTVENIISMKNGLMDLRKIVDGVDNPLIAHTPNFFTLSSLPYAYQPDAKCPRWHQVLDYALKVDPDLQWLMQEFYGLCLTHDTRFHAFLFLQGESRTGKSVAFEVLQNLVGLENVSSVPLRDFGGNFGLQPMLGKKLNINAEVPELDNVAEDILKEFTGGSTMLTYHRKNKESVITKQRPRLAFSSNHYPNFKDRSEGIWNRMILIPFRNVVPEEERDPNLIEYLIANELPGIFNWAIEGYARLVQNGGFTDSFVMRKERDDYRDQTVPTRIFFKEVLQLDDESPGETVADLYDLYKKWAKINGFRQQNVTTFGRDLKAYVAPFGIEQGKINQGRGYSGIGVDDGARQHIEARFDA
ncbi:MAG: phage/plasmid primase, P4 family [Candidatus Poribacteria bacterium]|nr:phage/plasmid primase, P4 family [Candidatus Poribacteria bacterium]